MHNLSSPVTLDNMPPMSDAMKDYFLELQSTSHIATSKDKVRRSQISHTSSKPQTILEKTLLMPVVLKLVKVLKAFNKSGR